MEAILYIIAKVVALGLDAISICMFLRVILQFFVDTQNNRLYAICVTVSEFFVMPFRAIMAKFNIMQNTPIDMPFFFAYIFIFVISMLMPAI